MRIIMNASSRSRWFPPLLVRIIFAILSILLFTREAAATDHPKPNTVDPVGPLRPLLITTPPVIDGNLDDPIWKLAPHVSGFKTFVPDYDIVPKEQTDVALAYDHENLYFAFRCYDDPSKIKASVSPRDKMTSDDFICIN